LISRDLALLRDICDAAGRAINHIGGLPPELLGENHSLQDGPVRCLIVMGEAAKHLTDQTRARFPEIDWSGMIGLRNILVHRYQEIDPFELWRIVNRDLEPVVKQLTVFLEGDR
jgi:uncharacterized protein with HEPN domain